MEKLLHNPDFISTLCGAAAFAVVFLIWIALVENDPLPADRLRSVQQRRSELREAQQKKLSRRVSLQRISIMKQVVTWLKMARGKGVQELRLKLARAGYRSRDAMFVFLFSKLVAPIGMACLASFFMLALRVGSMPMAPRFAIIIGAAIAGWILPDLLLRSQSQKREDLLRKAMPDALDLLVICAEAGLSLGASFERVSQEINPNAPELAEEIGLTAVELNFLPDRTRALHGLADRVPLPGVMALVNTLLQTEKYGTPLAQALRVLSAEMREERIMKAEEKAARLPAILTVPMIIFILPPLFVVLIGPAAIKVSEAMVTGH
jgi:tight adherence protein C